MAGERHFGLVDTILAYLLVLGLPGFVVVVGAVLLLNPRAPAKRRVLGAGVAAVGLGQMWLEFNYGGGCSETPGALCETLWVVVVAGWILCGLIVAVTLALIARGWIRKTPRPQPPSSSVEQQR